MDAETAIWLAGLIAQAVTALEHSPGMTVEDEANSAHWLQIVAEEADGEPRLGGFVLNFPYREHQGDPLETLQQTGLRIPPGTRVEHWEDGGFATIWVRPDVPLVALAHFVGDILARITGAEASAELAVKIEYGF
jgi:hypothetical protein